MKKIKLVIAFLLLAFVTASAQQQQVVRRSNIPYAFPEFQDATVRQLFGKKLKAKVNISLQDASLRYLDGKSIMVAYLDKVLGVDFDSVSYQKVDDKLGLIMAKKGLNYLVRVTTIDMVQYEKETGGTENMSFFDLSGAGGNVFMDLEYDPRDRKTGYPLKDTYYFWYSGKVIRANEREFKKIVPASKKKAFKQIVNNRWWSWKDEASLVELLDCLP